MGFEEQSKLLERYNEWKGQKKVSANDYSPEAFLIYEAQQEAYKRVETAIRYLRDETKWDQEHSGVKQLLKILEGE